MSIKEKAKKMNAKTKTRKEKKLSKAAIYAKYGIQYKAGKILSPIGWISELLKEGNTKTGKRVYTFSILPGSSSYKIEIDGKEIEIKGTCICTCIGCYAMTGNYRFSTTIHSLAVNTYLVNYHLDFVKACIAAQLEYLERGEIRIHAAGDFNTINSEKYASMWYEIAKRFQAFRFWTYTKIKKYETLFDELKNANIVKSVIPGIGFNFGKCEYIINAYYTLLEMGESVYICKCGIDKNQHCEKCGVCAGYKYVLFVEHSTGYNAELDPLYNKLCEIVNNQ